MENARDISEELKLLSPLVSSINRNTPFVLPVGYFNDLSDRVLAAIAASGSSDSTSAPSDLLAKIGKQLPFAVPSDYFETFAQKCLDHIKASDANKIPSGNMPATNTPTDSELAEGNEEMSAEKELEQLSSLLSGIRKSSPFRTPETYFTDLSTNVISGVRAIEFVNDELENFSPLLTERMNDLKNRPTYQAPSDYFENLAAQVLSKARQSSALPESSDISAASDISASSGKTAKIMAMPAKRTWWKYAAAAMTAGLILSAGWFSLNRPAKTSSNNPDILLKNLSKVSDQDIQNYLDNHNIPLAEAVNTSTAILDMNDTDVSEIKTMLGDVPDEELKSYLDEHGGTRDLATN